LELAAKGSPSTQSGRVLVVTSHCLPERSICFVLKGSPRSRACIALNTPLFSFCIWSFPVSERTISPHNIIVELSPFLACLSLLDGNFSADVDILFFPYRVPITFRFGYVCPGRPSRTIPPLLAELPSNGPDLPTAHFLRCYG